MKKIFFKKPLFWKHPITLLVMGSLLIWFIQQNVLTYLQRQEKLLERKYDVISSVASIPAEYYQEIWDYFFAIKAIREIQKKPNPSEKDWEILKRYEERSEKSYAKMQATIIKANSVGAQLILFKNKQIINNWNRFLETYWRGFYPISREGITEEKLNEQLNKAIPYSSKTIQDIFTELGHYKQNKFIIDGGSDMKFVNILKQTGKILITIGIFIIIFFRSHLDKIMISFRIIGPLLIICATFVSMVLVASIDKQIAPISEEISNFHDTRIVTMQGLLSYEGRDTLFAVHDVEYYQMLSHLHNLEREPESNKKEIAELEKTIEITKKTALDNNIFLAILYSTLLSKDRENEQETRAITNEIRDNKDLSMGQKIEKIRAIQNDNRNKFGDRIEEIQNKWLENREVKKHLTERRSLWQSLFVWMQIVGLSMLAIAGAIEGIMKKDVKSKNS